MARSRLSVGILAVAGTMTASAAAQRMTVTPTDGLVDKPFSVRVEGARAGAPVRIEARLQDEQNPPQVWTAVGEYRADAKGVVDTAVAPSIGGTYRGVVAGGLACSGLPVPVAEVPAFLEQLGKTPGRTRPLLGTRDAFTVDVTVTVDGKPTGPMAPITRRYAAADVTSSTIAEGLVNGVYFEPARATGIPVTVITGSGGGAWRDAAALLASRGHPALAIGYFNYPGLNPTLEDVPLEIFRDANRWLARRTGAQRLAMIGVSRGTEAVQLATVHFPERVAGVALLVPGPLVHGGFGPGGGTNRAAWSLGGEPVPFATLSQNATPAEREKAGRSLPGHSAAPAFLAEWRKPTSYPRWSIPFDKIDVPVLAIGGEKDEAWPSGFGAMKIKERMTALGKGGLVEAHVYPNAGHDISRPGLANLISNSVVHPVSKLWSTNGGVPEVNCAAGYDAWGRVVTFLGRLPR